MATSTEASTCRKKGKGKPCQNFGVRNKTTGLCPTPSSKGTMLASINACVAMEFLKCCVVRKLAKGCIAAVNNIAIQHKIV